MEVVWSVHQNLLGRDFIIRYGGPRSYSEILILTAAASTANSRVSSLKPARDARASTLARPLVRLPLCRRRLSERRETHAPHDVSLCFIEQSRQKSVCIACLRLIMRP